MKRVGQITLTPFPNTDLPGFKGCPVLLIRQASSRFDDWLVCIVPSQRHQAETGFDEILIPQDPDCADTSLKGPSVLRLSRGGPGAFALQAPSVRLDLISAIISFAVISSKSAVRSMV